MKEFKGTKGEWGVAGGFREPTIVNESGQVMFTHNQSCFDNEDDSHKYYSHNKMTANAKLIAAAPELLGALIELKKQYEELVDCGDCGKWNPRQDNCIVEAKRVINKALD